MLLMDHNSRRVKTLDRCEDFDFNKGEMSGTESSRPSVTKFWPMFTLNTKKAHHAPEVFHWPLGLSCTQSLNFPVQKREGKRPEHPRFRSGTSHRGHLGLKLYLHVLSFLCAK